MYETLFAFKHVGWRRNKGTEFHWKIDLFANCTVRQEFSNRISSLIRATDNSMAMVSIWQMARRMSSWSHRAFSWGLFTHGRARKLPRGNQPVYRRTQVAIRIRAPRRTFIHNVPRDETLKSHFNEKGKSRITALPLPDDGAVPAGTVDR